MECFWRKASKKEKTPLLRVGAPLPFFCKECPVTENGHTGESTDTVLFIFNMEREPIFGLIRDVEATKHFWYWTYWGKKTDHGEFAMWKQ